MLFRAEATATNFGGGYLQTDFIAGDRVDYATRKFNVLMQVHLQRQVLSGVYMW